MHKRAKYKVYFNILPRVQYIFAVTTKIKNYFYYQYILNKSEVKDA